MGKQVKWLHVSDWHVKASEDSSRDDVLRELVNDIRNMTENASHATGPFKPDFLLHTGDLAFSGQRPEYIKALTVLANLTEAAGLQPDNVFIVPGNHDVDDDQAINVECPDKTEDFDAQSYEQFCDEYFLRAAGIDSLLRRFTGFTSALKNVVNPDHRPNLKRPFFGCRISISEDVVVDIIGLTSALLSRKNDAQEGRRMYLGRKQVEKAVAELSGDGTPALRLALIHHPFEELYPYDRQQCDDVLRKNSIDIVHHGHLHQPAGTVHVNPDGSLVILGAGSSYEKLWSINGYNLCSYDVEARKLIVWFRKWVPDLRCFKPNNEVYRESRDDGSIELILKYKAMADIPKRKRYESKKRSGSYQTGVWPQAQYEKFGVFSGYVDLDSHERMRERISYQLMQRQCLDTKYLFWHVDSRKAYSDLLLEPHYTIARDSETVFHDGLPHFAGKIAHIAKSGACTLISLGAGGAYKEYCLLRDLVTMAPNIRFRLILLDLNSQMLQWALNQFRGSAFPQTATIQFLNADFDRLGFFKPLLDDVKEPVIFLLLGGLFGNLASERAFMRALKEVANSQTFLMTGFQTPEALAHDDTLGGYGTSAGFNFLEATLRIFDPKRCGKREMRVKVTDRFPSDVNGSETITVEVKTEEFGRAEIGFSRRYDPYEVLRFFEEEGCSVLRASEKLSKTYFKFLAQVHAKNLG